MIFFLTIIIASRHLQNNLLRYNNCVSLFVELVKKFCLETAVISIKFFWWKITAPDTKLSR